MEQGWIKLHRKLLDSLVFRSEKALKIWVWCLLKVNHKDNIFMLGRNKVEVQKGQFVFGSFTAKEELDLAVSTIWYWLEFLEKEGQVEIKRTNKYSVITIKNWKDYQLVENKSETNSEAKNKQIGTNKNDKNVKNDKNTSEPSSQDKLTINKVISSFKKINSEADNFYKNKTQRDACIYLVNKYTLEKVKKAIWVIDFNFSDNFCPKATNPTELKTKWAKIAMYHMGRGRKTPEYIKEFDKYCLEQERKNFSQKGAVKKVKAFVGGAEVSYELYEE